MNKKFRNRFALFIAILLLISSVSVGAQAFAEQPEELMLYGRYISEYNDSELDLTQIDLDDFLSLSAEEYFLLLQEFERVYDPFETYENDPVTINVNTSPLLNDPNDPPELSLYWTSGDLDNNGDYVEIGAHELITAGACSILINDKGFFANSSTGIVVIGLVISISSLLPDKDENGGLIPTFVGHFYNPHTGKSYNGSTSNTAKINAQNRYDTAVYYAKNNNIEKAFEYLGRCLHYIQDVNEPHHAANLISTNPLNGHSAFESYAFDRTDSYLSSYTSIPAISYYLAQDSVSAMAHTAALTAYSRVSSVSNIFDTSEWNTTARNCVRDAARYSAMVMYKFGLVTYVPFYYS